MRVPVNKYQLERVCRMYKTNADAARALGIASGSITRLCKQYGLETPTAKNKNKAMKDRKKYHEKLYHLSTNRPDFE